MRPTPSPARRHARRAGTRAALAVTAVALLAGCGGSARDAYEDSFSLGFPDPITDQGESIYNLWLGSVAAATVVGLFVWGLIFFAVVRYRKRGDELPRQVRYNLPVEVLYTVVPFVVIAVLFFYTAVSETYVNELTSEADGGPDVTVGVVGFQWNWTFNYTDPDDPSTVIASTTGVPGQPAELLLPVDRSIRFVETSNDVIHSFWVPAFLFKRDVIPGLTNQFEVTIREQGTFIGRCAELCGEKHDRMNFQVRVVSGEEFDAFIADSQQGTAAQAASATTSVESQ